MNDLIDLAWQPLSAGFAIAFLATFFGGLLFGFVSFVKRLLG